VSEDPKHGTSTIRPSHSTGGGGGGKWLLGALAAVVIAGGGYAAWKMSSQNQNNESQFAYTDDQYGADDPLRAGPVEGDDNVTAESASVGDDVAAPATAAVERRAARRAPAEPRTAEVPETTIGITPINATTEEFNEETEEVIVRPLPQPVWSRTPSARYLTALYPERARARGTEGEASLHCTVIESGRLNCIRAEETSSTFGAAAMRVAGSLRHAPQRADGTDAVGTPVNLRVVFRMEDENRRG